MVQRSITRLTRDGAPVAACSGSGQDLPECVELAAWHKKRGELEESAERVRDRRFVDSLLEEVDSNFHFRARNAALRRRPSSRSRGGWRGSAANSTPVSFLAGQGGERRGFSANWLFAIRCDYGDSWNKRHLIGQTRPLYFKPKDVRPEFSEAAMVSRPSPIR